VTGTLTSIDFSMTDIVPPGVWVDSFDERR
jgi:hypothetical protein